MKIRFNGKYGMLYVFLGVVVFAIAIFGISQLLNSVGAIGKGLMPIISAGTNVVKSYPQLTDNLTNTTSNILTNAVPLGAFEIYQVGQNAQMLQISFLLLLAMTVMILAYAGFKGVNLINEGLIFGDEKVG